MNPNNIRSSTPEHTRFLLPASRRFAQRFAGSLAARPRLALSPSRIPFNPHLLDRLQSPLTRFPD